MSKLNWEKDAESITQSHFSAINAINLELFRIIKEHTDKVMPVLPIIEYIIARIEAVTLLTLNGSLWDADIIVRSALETLTKFMLIADSVKSEQEVLLREYWKDLSEIYSIKLSEQAKKNLVYTSESEIHRLAYLPLVLSEEEELRLKTKWPKAIRTRLEQKWSFSGIIAFLSTKYKGETLESMAFLTQSYRISSHIAHGDEIGISMITERKSRNDKERNEVHIAHYLRLLMDCVSVCMITAVQTMMFLGLNFKFFTDIFDSMKEISALIDDHQRMPFEDAIYNKFR